MDPERTPVIVGVGQVNDRPDRADDGLDPIGLMAEALRRADRDAGGGWLSDCDVLAVVSQLAWPDLNPVDATLAERLGMAPRHREQTAKPNGDSPIRLLNEAANRIGTGAATICAVVGGEALRTAAALARPDALRNAPHRKRDSYAARHGLVVPVDVYPLYENAGRAARGETLFEGQAESGRLWAGMSSVAAACEHAWLRRELSAPEVITPTDRNRPIAFPYTKLQVANAAVNQGAGFLVTSLAEAGRRGVARDRLVFVGYGAAAAEAEDFLSRDSYATSPSLAVAIERCLAMNGLGPGELDHVELYSCFPCIPKLARRVLDWPLDRPITLFGGLTFGGGPIGNYMSHAVGCMVERLRRDRGTGLLFGNGGYATHNHAILLASEPTGAAFPRDFDCQGEADARRGPIPTLAEDYLGPATVETYTVHYDRDGLPRLGTIVARTIARERTLAVVPPDDRGAIAFLTDGAVEPVGAPGTIVAGADGVRIWVPGGL